MKSTLEYYGNKSVRLESVIDNLPHAIIVLDADTKIVLANNMAEMFSGKLKIHLFGLRGGEAFGCVNAHNVPEGCGYAEECRQCVVRSTVEKTFRTCQSETNVEASLELEEKGEMTLMISTTYLGDDTLVILAMNDITDFKKREEILVENQKLLAAIETGAAVCHEINQPLTIISGYLDMMELGMCKDNSVEDCIEEMKNSMERLRKLSIKLMSLKKYRTVEYYKDTRILELSE